MPRLSLPERRLRELREVLARWAPDAEAWAFGSRVDGTGHDGSDLDLVLRNPADLAQRQRHLAELKSALSESTLPILVDVLDWAQIPESFHREIKKNYVPVWPGAA